MAYIDIKSRSGDKFVLKYDIAAYPFEDGDYIASLREGGDVGEYETYVYPKSSSGEIEIDCSSRSNLIPRGIFRYYTWNGKVIVDSKPVPFPNQQNTPPQRPSAPKPNFNASSTPSPTISKSCAPHVSNSVTSNSSPKSQSSSKKKSFGKFGKKSLGSIGKKLSSGVTAGVRIVDAIIAEGTEASNTSSSQSDSNYSSLRTLDPSNSAVITKGGLEIPELNHLFSVSFKNPPPHPDICWDESYLKDLPEFFSEDIVEALSNQYRADMLKNDRNYQKLLNSKKINPENNEYTDYLKKVTKSILNEEARLKKLEQIPPCLPYGFGNDHNSHLSKNAKPNENTKQLQVGMVLEFMGEPSIFLSGGDLDDKTRGYVSVVEIIDIRGDDLVITKLRSSNDSFTYYHQRIVKYNHDFIGPIGSAQLQKQLNDPYIHESDKTRELFKNYPYYDYPNFFRYLNRRPVPRSFFGRIGFAYQPNHVNPLKKNVKPYIGFSYTDYFVGGKYDAYYDPSCGMSAAEWDKKIAFWACLPHVLLATDIPDGMDIEKIACGRGYEFTDKFGPSMVFFQRCFFDSSQQSDY